ncbi:hypothetical protein OOU_Y34scaffold00444g1 [Pyricularia oryzae Y34]|uniref:Uncharacterized protein n=3 Tax=Pyricularia oryzae TaxID=318829 RepID=A0A4P7NBD4_PYROR|nr:hypothetical protein OOU_Y34scaffold00444g1 [Pyricularia oryzae Y34]QBZ60078.1 hypothetical protein PoMZ_05048 [Pyricularia oryzae]
MFLMGIRIACTSDSMALLLRLKAKPAHGLAIFHLNKRPAQASPITL